ncbi:ABC transporter ATP-binding protein [Agrococcus sp. Ld7]|uniref:ABC transporter ATP-binding protein n=1 Tax=Agrococcus sp. Ld7 TaxID=649148 RepID=UPI0038635F8F
MADDSTILSLQGLTKRYGDATALEHVDLDVQRGEFLTFLGPSGSGKTTTLNLIAGFIEASEGSMLLDGAPLEKLQAHERNLGVVFQHYALFPHMTVRANVEFPLKQRKMSKPERVSATDAAMEMVRLGSYAERFPRQLSGGQQQRVALARALVYRPPILLMDEPLGALDKKLREWLQLELRRIHRELGSTFIYVTHDQEEALVLSDRIAVFNEGRIEQIGTAHELYDAPETLFVGRFIGEATVIQGTLAQGRFSAGGRELQVAGSIASQRGAVLIRPENLHISDAAGTSLPERAVNRIEGTIEDMVYLGPERKYNVTTELGVAIVRVPEREAAAARIGDRVLVGWAPEDAVLLDDAESQDEPVRAI